MSRVNTLIQEEVPDPTTLACAGEALHFSFHTERETVRKELRVRERGREGTEWMCAQEAQRMEEWEHIHRYSTGWEWNAKKRGGEKERLKKKERRIPSDD